MSILIRVLKLSLLLPLMQCIQGKPQSPDQPLQKLNLIVTDRINTILKQDQQLRSQSANADFLKHYQRLSLAAALPVAQLDEKIRAYSAYRTYGEKKSLNEAQDLPLKQLQQRIRQHLKSSSGDRTEFSRQETTESAFDQRVIILLEKLGLYDKDKQKVADALLNDENLLRMLRDKLKQLDEMDKNKDKNKDKDRDCCLWDLIFGLF
ncbi:hypothetical protein ACLKA7_002432 [Drosophila subpalustris]